MKKRNEMALYEMACWHRALSAQYFKVNSPYNSSTKILVVFPQARVSRGELEGLFAAVCCGGSWSNLIIKFDSQTALFLACMKCPVSSASAAGNAEWQVLQNSARVQSVAKVMTLWQPAVKRLDNRRHRRQWRTLEPDAASISTN